MDAFGKEYYSMNACRGSQPVFRQVLNAGQ